jgi:hypothetical protein
MMTITELKAQQYDDLAQVQFLQRRIQERDQEIMRLMQEAQNVSNPVEQSLEPVETPEEKPKK